EELRLAVDAGEVAALVDQRGRVRDGLRAAALREADDDGGARGRRGGAHGGDRRRVQLDGGGPDAVEVVPGQEQLGEGDEVRVVARAHEARDPLRVHRGL